MADSYRGGGSFIVGETEPRCIATPEDCAEERHRLAAAAQAFAEREGPLEGADAGPPEDEGTIRLVRRAGEVGLLGAAVPEAYGGLELNGVGLALLAEALAPVWPIARSSVEQAEAGMLPIALFGTPEQKLRWLSALTNGERIAAYGAAESDIGSEALASGMSAALAADGKHFVLNGCKRGVANAGGADLFVVFAKVDGTQLSAFVVERGTPGLTIALTESERGIAAAPVGSLLFEDARIPAENLLGEVGQGRRIAYGALNVGRFKLSAGCVGGMKEAVALAAAYANRNRQFGKPLFAFPLIAAKLADMSVRTFVAESVVYRTAGLIDEAASAPGSADRDTSEASDASDVPEDSNVPDAPDASDRGCRAAEAFAEYALECSIGKIFASEALEAVAAETVQIHAAGGVGIRDGKVERICGYSRAARFLEGANEINRLFIPAALLRRAIKSDLPLIEKAQALQQELLDSPLLPLSSASPEAPLAKPGAILSALKKTFLMVGGLAVQKHGLRLEREQTIVAAFADAMIDIYTLESALIRSGKQALRTAGASAAAHQADMTALFAEEAAERAGTRSRTILASLERGDELLLRLSALKRLLRFVPGDAAALRKRIAARVVAASPNGPE